MSGLLLRFAGPLAIATLVIIAVLAGALKIEAGRLGRAQQALAVEKALRAGDAARFEAAQTMANAQQQARIDALNQDYRRRRDETEQRTADLARDYRARVLRIAAGTDHSGGGTGIALPAAGPAPGTDRPGGDSLVLARTDALTCAENSARLQAAHEWATGLAKIETKPVTTQSNN